LVFTTLGNGVTFTNSVGSVGLSHSLQQLSNTSAITSNALATSQSSLFDLTANTSRYAGTGSSLNLTNLTGTLAVNTNGVAISLSGNPAQTVQPVAFSASGGSSAFSTLVFTTLGNGVTFTNSVGSVGLSHSLQQLSNTSAITSNALATSQSSLFDLTANTSRYAGTGTSLNLTNLTGTLAVNTNGVAISLSAAAPGAGGGIVAADGGGNSITSGTMLFSNANGVSFGINGQTVTASVAGGGGGGWPVAFSASGGSSSFSTLSFSNLGNDVTFSNSVGQVAMSHSLQALSNTSNITSNAAPLNASTRFIQTSQSSLFQLTADNTKSAGIGTSLNLTNLTGTLSVNSAGVAISMSGNPAQTVQPVAFSASGGSSAFSTLSFSNLGNDMTFSNSAGQVALSHSLQALSNTSAITAAAFPSAQTTKFAGTGTTFGGTNISGSMTLNSNGLVLSLSGGAGGGGADGVNIVQIGTTGTLGASFSTSNGTVFFNGSNGVLLSQTSNTINVVGNQQWFLVGNTAGANSSSSMQGSLYLSGGANITLSNNGSTVAIVGAAGGGGAAYSAAWWQPEIYGSQTFVTQPPGTLYLRPFELMDYVDVDKVIFQLTGLSQFTTQSFSASVSAGNASSGTGSAVSTFTALFFSRLNTNETNANYNSIITFDSRTLTMAAGYSASASWSTNASSATCSISTSAGFSFVKNIDGAGGFTTSSTTSSGSTSFSSTSTNANSFSSSFVLSFPYANASGWRPLFVPAGGTVMTPGEYWIGLLQSTNSASTNMSLQRNCFLTLSPQAYTASTNSYVEYGGTTTIGSSNFRLGFGSYSSSGNTTTAIALTAVSAFTSAGNANASLYFALDGHPL